MPEKHEERIQELVTRIRIYKTDIESLTAHVDNARKEVEELLLDRGTPWKDEEGYAMIIAEGERTSYDTKALDELLISNPLQYGWLSDYRRKTTTKASLKVK